jgi:MFS family permease
VRVLVFGTASAWFAYSGSAGMLIAPRTTLGVGAAMMIPLSMAVLPSIFPDAADRARAMTIWVTSTAVGLPLGPILGGWLLAHAWWGAIFLINAPLVALSSTGLTALTFGFIRAGQQSWTDDAAMSAIAAGAVLLVVFVGWQTRAGFPLVGLNLFSNRDFRWPAFFLTMVGTPHWARVCGSCR